MDSLNTTTLIAIVAVAVILVAFVAWLAWSANQSKRLKQRFGPEYDEVVRRTGSKAKAEADAARLAAHAAQQNPHRLHQLGGMGLGDVGGGGAARRHARSLADWKIILQVKLPILTARPGRRNTACRFPRAIRNLRRFPWIP